MDGVSGTWADDRIFDAGQHPEALARLASANLSAGRHEPAFRLADRRLRLIRPAALDFLLRAEALRLLGRTGEARVDLASAIAQDPTSPEVNLAAMRWGDPGSRQSAASRLIASGCDAPAALAEAVGLLFAGGERLVHRLIATHGGFRGWAAWLSGGPPELRVRNGRRRVAHLLTPDPASPIAVAPGFAAEFEIRDADAVELAFEGKVLASLASAPAAQARDEPPIGEISLSVVVPIHGDVEATRACLESLLGQADASGRQIVLVDDAAPDPRMRALLEAAAARPGVRLLRNAVNLGFAASVNRALAISGSGDVLVLNADTLLPPGAVRRLAEVAHSAPDIGTVTPFSNNGEETSWPEPGLANATPSPAEVDALDRLAWRLHGRGVVDLVNGVGFCLYITRACLDAVGVLTEIYQRGYYEDVEFCLVARERGFRNVCATGVFVGHVGSRSFRAEKRALVVRNLALLEARFPRYRGESDAFQAADPLNSARAALEEFAPPAGEVLLIACGPGRASFMAEARARELAAEPDAPAVVLARVGAGEDRVDFVRAGEGAPKSLSFPLSDPGLARLRAYLGRLRCVGLELFDATGVPARLLMEFSALDAPMHLIAADLQAFRRTPGGRKGACASTRDAAPCEDCLAAFAVSAASQDEDMERRVRLALALAKARAIRPLDRMGAAFARRVFGHRAEPFDTPPDPLWPARAQRGRSLGILAPFPSAETDRLLIRLARLPALHSLDVEIVVIGRCLDDLAVMASGPVFVTGPAAPAEHETMIARYRIGALASFDRSAFFGPLQRLSRRSGAPMAYFDAAFGALASDPGDLALDPRLCDAKAAAAIAFWLRSVYPA